jgi:hypothetical protein
MSHIGVNQFQVGEISDIDVQTNTKTPTKYPMVFMVPQQSTLDRGGLATFGFSLVVADIAKNQMDLQVNTHNSTLMIMQDLFSRIVLTNYDQVDINIQTPVNIIPFQERFNNNLTGWTAEINVEMKSPFDLCQAAFDTGISPSPTTTPVYSQVVNFSSTPMNSINYKCGGTTVHSCYGTNQTNLPGLIAMFNAVPKVQNNACFLDYGTYHDNGDGRVRCDMPNAVYQSLCLGGTLTLDVIYD